MKKFREQGNYHPELNSAANVTEFPDTPEQDRTVQSHKDDADINVMIKRFGIARLAQPQPTAFYDMTELADYQSSLNNIEEARRRFMTVPAELRERFRNDPAQLIAYIRDENNHEEARKLGLLTPKADPPAPMKVEVINPVVAPSA